MGTSTLKRLASFQFLQVECLPRPLWAPIPIAADARRLPFGNTASFTGRHKHRCSRLRVLCRYEA